MPVDKIEAIVDAISHHLGSSTNPDGVLYQIRNPLALRSFSLPGKDELDENGHRIFKNWSAGYHASCYDVRIKISGESRSGLKKDDLLENLLGVYGIKEPGGQDRVIKFLKRALKTQEVKLSTPLAWFRE